MAVGTFGPEATRGDSDVLEIWSGRMIQPQPGEMYDVEAAIAMGRLRIDVYGRRRISERRCSWSSAITTVTRKTLPVTVICE